MTPLEYEFLAKQLKEWWFTVRNLEGDYYDKYCSENKDKLYETILALRSSIGEMEETIKRSNK